MKLKQIKNLSGDEVLAALGLARRQSALSATLISLGLVTLGIALGAGTALLAAPKSGRDLRRELGDRVGGAGRRVVERVREGVSRQG
jgi:hypothetical protein